MMLHGDVEKIALLLSSGQKVDARDKHSRTALHIAAWAGQEGAVEALLAANANKGASAMDDMNALHFAAQKGHTGTSKMLIKAGLPVSTKDRKGQTALHIAAAKGHNDLVRVLLGSKADPHACNRKGQNSLDSATSEETKQIIQEAIAQRQAKLDKIKASAAETSTSGARPNMRKKEDASTGSPQDAAEPVEPKAKRPKVALSHLGDEDE